MLFSHIFWATTDGDGGVVFSASIPTEITQESLAKTKDNLADLSSDELLEIVGDKVQGLEEANKIIMKAREDWFNDIN